MTARCADALPCPFCGSQNVGIRCTTSEISGRTRWFALCLADDRDCVLGPSANTPDNALALWNDRIDVADLFRSQLSEAG